MWVSWGESALDKLIKKGVWVSFVLGGFMKAIYMEWGNLKLVEIYQKKSRICALWSFYLPVQYFDQFSVSVV